MLDNDIEQLRDIFDENPQSVIGQAGQCDQELDILFSHSWIFETPYWED